MQDNQWAEVLTNKPSRTAARYEPSSPRARFDGLPVAGTTRDTSSLGRPTSTLPTSASRGASSNSGATHSERSALTRSTSPASEDSLSAAHALNNRLQSSTTSGGEASRYAQKQHSHVTKQRAARGHVREPQAVTGRQRTMSRSASQSKGSLSHESHATAPRKGKTSHIFCGNNILSPKLRRNGGDMEIGSPSQCFRKGFGAGFYQTIDPAHLEEFLADNSGAYKRYIEQPLYYGDGPVPAGKIRATLSQCRSRGFGVGSVQRAKKILKERKHGISKA